MHKFYTIHIYYHTTNYFPYIFFKKLMKAPMLSTSDLQSAM